MRVLAIEPYYTLSHAGFLEGYRDRSRHEVRIWSLPPRKWKWRMRGAAIHFADEARRVGPRDAPDVVIASDFLNLSEWRSLAPAGWRDRPTILYFHENQITYPLGSQAPRDFHYGWINLSSALAAERVLFNSEYHRREFLAEVGRVLRRMPDHVPEDIPGRIERGSAVFPVGIDFEPHRRARDRSPRRENPVPVIVWNHRWEYDKGPDLLVDALREVGRRGIPFRLNLCGQSFRRVPEGFEQAVAALGDAIAHRGFVEDRAAYLDLLGSSDLVLSTARHEFFGVAVVEAMYLGCLPVLPRALSYPEILPERLHAELLYDAPGDLPDLLGRILLSPPRHLRPEVEAAAARFDWRTMAEELDRIVDEAGSPAARGG